MTTLREPPVWRRIAQTLSAEIETDALAPGARLPTEAQLAARFGVNRHTVRRAMEALVRRGSVRVEQGRGAFVAGDLLEYPVLPRTRFSEWVKGQNKVPEGVVLRAEEVAASRPVAAALGIAPGAPVALMERLGRADGLPISLADHYFSAERLPGITAALRDAPSVTEALASVGVSDYVRQSTRVLARMPTPLEADRLQIARTRPLLICENVNVDLEGRLIEFGVAKYPSSRVQVVFEP